MDKISISSDRLEKPWRVWFSRLYGIRALWRFGRDYWVPELPAESDFDYRVLRFDLDQSLGERYWGGLKLDDWDDAVLASLATAFEKGLADMRIASTKDDLPDDDPIILGNFLENCQELIDLIHRHLEAPPVQRGPSEVRHGIDKAYERHRTEQRRNSS